MEIGKSACQVCGVGREIKQPAIKTAEDMQVNLKLNQYAVPVVPGQAGGGSFQKEKNYIAKKEFAYRMCARRPTSAMPKSFLCLCSPSAVPWW